MMRIVYVYIKNLSRYEDNNCNEYSFSGFHRHSKHGNDAPDSRNKRWRRADTNVVSVKFDHLLKPSNMHTGDYVRCSQCTGLMSHLSKLQESGDRQVIST